MIMYSSCYLIRIYSGDNKIYTLQSFSQIIETTAKNGVVSVAISNVKLF